MNKIVFPMKVHAVKLEYRRLELEKIMHGHFRMRNGRKYVYVTYDPQNPKIDSRHSCKLLADSRRGKNYALAVSRFLELRHEYLTLLNEWNTRYGVTPPRVIFPIIQFSDPHKMNNEYYNRAVGQQGKYKPDNPTVSEHGELKSKNEQMGADLLKLMDIPFKYELELAFINTDEKINPDYLINFYEIDRCSYLEILGMNDRADYSIRAATKINSFSKDVYRPGREVIYVHLYDKANFDEVYFVSQIMAAFDSMIPDSALIWESQKEVG